MPTLTVKLPHELDARLVREAKKRGVSKSQLARKALEDSLDAEGVNEEPSAYEVMKPGLGCINSGIGNLSTDPKHMEGFGR